MKNLLTVILITFICIYFLPSEVVKKQKKIEPMKTVTISLVGDLMCHGPQYEYARIQKDSFDFHPVFSEIKKYLSAADITIGNLETIIEGKGSGLSSYPLFNSPIEYLDALKDAGFDLLITSNNHCLDKGVIGIDSTIANIEKERLKRVGTFRSQEDRDSIRIINVNGINLAILSYTYGVNGNSIPSKKSFVVNLIDSTLIKKDIEKARTKSAEIVLVYFHFGEEYQRVSNSYQKEVVKKTISYGADFIIGSHPHSIQPIEYFIPAKSKLEKGIVAYSLGNFISNQRWRYSDCGVILNITLEKIGSEKIILDTISIIPTWVFKGRIGNKNQFVILPSDTNAYESIPSYLTKADKEKLMKSFNDTKRTLSAVHSFKRKTSLHTN